MYKMHAIDGQALAIWLNLFVLDKSNAHARDIDGDLRLLSDHTRIYVALNMMALVIEPNPFSGGIVCLILFSKLMKIEENVAWLHWIYTCWHMFYLAIRFGLKPSALWSLWLQLMLPFSWFSSKYSSIKTRNFKILSFEWMMREMNHQ